MKQKRRGLCCTCMCRMLGLLAEMRSIAGGERDASIMIFLPCAISIAFACFLFWVVSQVKIRGNKGHTSTPADDACYDELETCYETVSPRIPVS